MDISEQAQAKIIDKLRQTIATSCTKLTAELGVRKISTQKTEKVFNISVSVNGIPTVLESKTIANKLARDITTALRERGVANI